MKNVLRISLTIVGLFAPSLGSQLHAQLLGFDLAGLTGTETTAASTFQATGVNASTLTRGAGVSASIQGQANTDIFNASWFGATSVANAVTNNQYFQWTFSATSTASLSSLNYSVYAQNNGNNPQNFSGDVQYSLDGFATTGVDLGGFTGVTPQSGTNNYLGNPESNNLSSVLALQNIAAGQTVTFRFYGYNGAGFTDQGFGRASPNDLNLSGTLSAVPEPSTWAMMLGGLGILVWFQRRARRA
jgi:hypothetical protein